MKLLNWSEVAILGFLIQKPEAIEEIDISIFEDAKSREMYKLIQESAEENKEITTKDMGLILGREYNLHLKKLRLYLRRPPAQSIVSRMLGNKIVKQALLESIPDLAKLGLKDYEDLKEAINIAEGLDFCDEGTSIEDHEKEESLIDKDELGEEGFPFLLDGVFLYPGEVGLVEALPKGCKTLALTHLGGSALTSGMKVYHWSLEIPKKQLFRRYAGRLVGRPHDLQKAGKFMRCCGGELIVRDEPYCNMIELRNWVLKGKPDILIVDYADLMNPVSRQKEKRFELREIYLGLRRIAKEFNIPVLTASQATAASKKKVERGGHIDIEDLEEAKIVKAGICALIISLNQTPEEKEDNVMRCFIILSTHGYKGRRFVDVDYTKQYLKEQKRHEAV